MTNVPRDPNDDDFLENEEVDEIVDSIDEDNEESLQVDSALATSSDEPEPAPVLRRTAPGPRPIQTRDRSPMEASSEPAPPNELDILKARARMLGLTFSNNIKLDALKQRVNDAIEGKVTPPEKEEVQQANALDNETGADEGKPKLTKRQKMVQEQMRLVRIRITCLDPKKKDLHGEIITVANSVLGTIRKFIPFGELSEEGYHVPYILYNLLKEREFLNIRTIKDRQTGRLRVESNYVKEFAIEVLPQLTPREIHDLATAQKAAGSVDGALRR